ncbi:MAG: SH3 domain-containing protein [Alkalispirochaeta sp.]
MKNYRQVLGLVLGVVSVLIGCSAEDVKPGIITGTVPGTPLEPGTFVEVEPLDSRAGTYTVIEVESANSYQVLPPLVRVFETREAADQFLEDTANALGVTATSQVHALRVRAEPRLDADVVYRLRSGEEVQLVRSTDTSDTINGRTGVWYELIAGGQHRGYAFGPLLAGTPSEAARLASSGDQSTAPLTVLTEALGGDVWISSATEERFAAGGRDLTAMRLTDDAVVLRMNDEERRITLDSAEIDGDVAEFEDAQVRMMLGAEDEVRVRLDGEEGARFMVFRPYEESRWVQLWTEYQRRREIAELLTEHVGRYRSATYGTVRISDAGAIQWTDKQALIPRVFPSDQEDDFDVQYLPRLSGDLRSRYDGAIMLDVPLSDTDPVFLVDLLPQALRLVWVPDFDRDNPTVSSSPVTPLIMYFSSAPEVLMPDGS